jgi:hypothetical protein
MINSLDIVTIKAILVALAQQSSPLKADIQKQINELGEDLIENLNELQTLFFADPDLAKPFGVVIEQLAPSGQRNKSLDVTPTPNAQAEQQNPENRLIENVAQLRHPTNLENLLSELQKSDYSNLCEMTTTILQSKDSVKTAHENLSRCLSSYPLGKTN